MEQKKSEHHTRMGSDLPSGASSELARPDFGCLQGEAFLGGKGSPTRPPCAAASSSKALR